MDKLAASLDANDATASRFAHIDDRFSKTDREIADVRGQLYGVAQDMASVKASVATMVNQFGEIANKVHAPTPKTNWVAIAALSLSIVVGGSNYVDLRLIPAKEDITALYDITDAARLVAGDQRERLARLEAEVVNNRRDLDVIDEKGSRRWIGDKGRPDGGS